MIYFDVLMRYLYKNGLTITRHIVAPFAHLLLPHANDNPVPQHTPLCINTHTQSLSASRESDWNIILSSFQTHTWEMLLLRRRVCMWLAHASNLRSSGRSYKHVSLLESEWGEMRCVSRYSDNKARYYVTECSGRCINANKICRTVYFNLTNIAKKGFMVSSLFQTGVFVSVVISSNFLFFYFTPMADLFMIKWLLQRQKIITHCSIDYCCSNNKNITGDFMLHSS